VQSVECRLPSAGRNGSVPHSVVRFPFGERLGPSAKCASRWNYAPSFDFEDQVP
jgi:hypothetical protein